MGKLGGDAVNDVVYCAYAGMLMDSDAGAKAFRKFAKRFGQNPDVYSPFYYDQVINIGEEPCGKTALSTLPGGRVHPQNAHKGVME